MNEMESEDFGTLEGLKMKMLFRVILTIMLISTAGSATDKNDKEKKAAFIVGGTYGRGTMVCRSGKTMSGTWGAPAMFVLEGGSVGFQIGGEATDFVLLIMNDHGANSLLHSKVKLGGDVSAAAGPVGRTAEANTDAYLRSEILTYSRARGLFAGVSLEGASLRPDEDGNEALYGRKISASEIVLGPSPAIPSSGQHLVALLEKASPTSRAHN